MLDQAKAFLTFARKARFFVRGGEFDLVYGTSSRLMTAALSAFFSWRKKVPLYLDIRDIFVDTIKDVLPKGLAFLAGPLFVLLEKITISRASKVNLVSLGFRGYFLERYPNQKFSFFPNGIDTEFASFHLSEPLPKQPGEPLVVLYAGNIGEGQGLQQIIPELAKQLEGQVHFRIIGDGGRRPLLEQKTLALGCKNVEILPPIKRDQLLVEYEKADILFLHLNDYEAFRKVLPSKLFEYAAVGKPILAGVAGYAAEFVEAEIDNAVVFHPCDVRGAVRVLGGLKFTHVNRSVFVEKYSRESIMLNMASDILTIVPKGC
ncbi:colanic acid biosynthesis glycosyltransferase WcaI [compost metagenome]